MATIYVIYAMVCSVAVPVYALYMLRKSVRRRKPPDEGKIKEPDAETDF